MFNFCCIRNHNNQSKCLCISYTKHNNSDVYSELRLVYLGKDFFFHSVPVKTDSAVNRVKKVVMGIKILFLYKKYACKIKKILGCISIVNVHISQDTLMHIFSTIRLFLLMSHFTYVSAFNMEFHLSVFSVPKCFSYIFNHN